MYVTPLGFLLSLKDDKPLQKKQSKPFVVLTFLKTFATARSFTLASYLQALRFSQQLNSMCISVFMSPLEEVMHFVARKNKHKCLFVLTLRWFGNIFKQFESNCLAALRFGFSFFKLTSSRPGMALGSPFYNWWLKLMGAQVEHVVRSLSSRKTAKSETCCS